MPPGGRFGYPVMYGFPHHTGILLSGSIDGVTLLTVEVVARANPRGDWYHIIAVYQLPAVLRVVRYTQLVVMERSCPG